MTNPRLSMLAAGMKATPSPQLIPRGLSLAEAVRQDAENRTRRGSSEAPAPLRIPPLPQNPFPGYKGFPGYKPFPGYKGVK